MARPAPPFVATYRLQLRNGVTLDDAAALVPHLAALGISHLYLSPFFAAVPGSTHGYDVVDPGQVDPSLGGVDALLALRAALDARGMGLVADVVPNHAGIAGSRQPWWRDVLRYGQASPFARFFDIDWHGLPHIPPGVLLLPLLGAPLGDVLERGEIRLEVCDGEIVFRYHDHALPLSPSHYAEVLHPGDGTPPPAPLAALFPGLASVEHDHSEAARAAFACLLESGPGIAAFVKGRLAVLNGAPGIPRSFDRLEALLLRQHYRPRHWRTAGDEMNYRRFFVISDLAALRMEDPGVFDACHAFILQLAQDGLVDALRVDHVGGLANPPAYLRKLRAALDERGCPHVPVYVEKVLARDEGLSPGWPVAGTTGYDFLATVEGLFIDPAAETPLSRTYQALTGNLQDFATIAYAARRAIADRWFASEIDRLAVSLSELATADRRAHDLTLRAIRSTVLALLGAFHIYRMYDPDRALRALREAAREAAAREALDPAALDFVVRALEPPRPGEAEDAHRAGFRQRFGHLSVPVVAKGVEDTAFYRYARLLALNEVGASPAVFSTPPAALHAWFGARARRWPLAMSASTTHDTKRSEDARARLVALSEFPGEWDTEVRAWFELARPLRGAIDGQAVPSPETEYYLYQSLVASWPGEASPAYRERMATHLLKAMREASRETSWLAVDEPYEQLSLAFLDALLADDAFTGRLSAFVARLEPVARLNGLSALALKVLAPGLPDFYQGSELPLHTLTDPDNRQPVDFEGLAAAVASLPAACPPPHGPLAKPWLTRRLLAIRRRHYALATSADYRPLEVTGPLGDHLFAFVRHHEGEWLALAVPRLCRPLLAGDGAAIQPGAWNETALVLPVGVAAWHSLLDGHVHRGSALRVGELLHDLPLAVLHGRASEAPS